MKKILHTLFLIFEAMGKAKAATYFTRQGNYEAARKVMQE